MENSEENKIAESHRHEDVVIPPIAILEPTNRIAVLPIWIRLPKPGQIDPITSLPRSSMWGLVERAGGRIKSVSLRAEGATKGTRLIHLKSLLEYLDGMQSDLEEV